LREERVLAVVPPLVRVVRQAVLPRAVVRLAVPVRDLRRGEAVDVARDGELRIDAVALAHVEVTRVERILLRLVVAGLRLAGAHVGVARLLAVGIARMAGEAARRARGGVHRLGVVARARAARRAAADGPGEALVRVGPALAADRARIVDRVVLVADEDD